MSSVPVDLDALDRLRASVRVRFPWREEGGEIISADKRYPMQSADETPDPEHAFVVALVNAYPALVAELRTARATLTEGADADPSITRAVYSRRVAAARVGLPDTATWPEIVEAAERRGIERAAEVCDARGARYRTTARTNRATAKAIRSLLNAADKAKE